jgi:hypothetical protein
MAQSRHQRNHLLFAVLALVNSVWVFLTYLSINRIGTLEPEQIVVK